MNSPVVAPADLADARRSANRRRNEALLRLHLGQTTVEDLLWEACENGNKPLLSLRLFKILETAPGIGSRHAKALMTRFCRCMGEPTDSMRKLTVAWLITPTTRGRRREVWVDTVSSFGQDPQPPWRGFPWLPRRDEEG